jgi:hypothetical protein
VDGSMGRLVDRQIRALTQLRSAPKHSAAHGQRPTTQNNRKMAMKAPTPAATGPAVVNVLKSCVAIPLCLLQPTAISGLHQELPRIS